MLGSIYTHFLSILVAYEEGHATETERIWLQPQILPRELVKEKILK